jgi:prephenate dehydrogenase
MKTAIIGAGKMGRWFAKFFLEEGDSVIVSSRSREKLLKIRDEFEVEVADNVNAVKNSDRILICVPIENFEEVVREIHSHVRPEQVIMDICSIKGIPVKIMHKYIKTGTTLGTHPVFGPGAKSIKGQNFILTPIGKKEKKFAENFKGWLEERQANVFIMSPRKHDELMSAVLGLPHFLGLVACDTLLNCPNFLETKKVAGPSYKILLNLVEVAVFEETEFYTSIQMNLPETEKIEGLFLEKSEEWLNIVRRKDGSSLASKMELVKKKLRKVNPNYVPSHEVTHRLLGSY